MGAADECRDLDDLSKFLGFAPQHLFKLVKTPQLFYHQIFLKKRSGDLREVFCPKSALRGVQRAILDKILTEIPVHNAAHGYVKGRSVISCATKLANPETHLLKLDIEDFFPSILDVRVFGLFSSLGFSATASHILTRLTTFKRHAVQGAPTSPYISNLITRGMDKALTTIAAKYGAEYFRYSDDLFFSTRDSINFSALSNAAERIISRNGFKAKAEKKRIYRSNGPKIALGFRLNTQSPELTRSTKRRYRAIFHRAAMYPTWGRDQIDKLEGICAWYRSVSGADSTYKEYRSVIASLRTIKAHEPYSV